MPSYLLAAFFCFLCFVACSFFFQRFRWNLRKRLGKHRLGFYPSSASLGNAFQTLQAIAQPQVEHMVEEKVGEEEVDADESGGPDDTTQHLKGQIVKRKKQRKLEQLTVRLPRDPH